MVLMATPPPGGSVRTSSPDRRRIRLRRWIRLIKGILNAKAAIACAGQLALLPRYEPAVLGATTPPAAKVGAPRIDDNGGTRPRTRRKRDYGYGHQTCNMKNAHGTAPGELLFAPPRSAYRRRHWNATRRPSESYPQAIRRSDRTIAAGYSYSPSMSLPV
jgi:hypothetical protein